MAIYIDTSALAKWYINEAFSDEVEAFIRASGPVDISTLTLVEMRSLLGRRRRERSIDATTESRAFATLEADVHAGHLVSHMVEDRHVQAALTLLPRFPDHPLRTLDALHLAIAGDLQAETIATADRIMADSAQAIGFVVVGFMSSR